MLSPLKPVPGAAKPKPNVRKTLDTSRRLWSDQKKGRIVAEAIVRDAVIG